ncbi:sialidase family protein [Azohydromonas aeria]|uniref:sialidase family protein n=1 Tax=Azohydromonas aeria TaxID=2590212 RepID=UPI0012FCA35E|nr:sialidase family protein [Azohydromonas aeria]
MRSIIAATPGVFLFLTGPLAWAAASVPTVVAGPSVIAGCTADAATTQPGTYYPGSQAEPWVDGNPRAGFEGNFVAGFQQDRWSNGGSRTLGYASTLNDGATWTVGAIPGITLCTGGEFQRATDPWVSFSPDGSVYFMTLALDITTPPNRSGGDGKNAMLVSKSINGGQSWGPPMTLIRDDNPRFLNDKNTITADPGDSRYVYAVWGRLQAPVGSVINPENAIGLGFKGPATFTRTTDAGATWEPARKIYDPGANSQTIGNQIVVLPDGTLLNVFNEILNFKNSNGGAQFDSNLALVRSFDKGATWTRGPALRGPKTQPMSQVRASSVMDPDAPAGTVSAVRTGDIIPQVAVNRRAGTAGYGHLYAVWQDASFSGMRYDQIAFSRSTDGGQTWSAPIRISQTPTTVPEGNRQAFTATVRVASDGTIGVSYYDFRYNTPDPATLPTDYFLVSCKPAPGHDCTQAAHWSGSEQRITPQPFDMRQAPVARGFFLGDYMGLAADANGGFKALFVQSRPAAGDAADLFLSTVQP